MVSYLIGISGFLVTSMLQMSVFSQWKILSGSADIILLFLIAWSLYDRSKHYWLLVLFMAGFVGSISAVPALIPLLLYFAIFYISRLFQSRLMQSPLLGMILITFGASMLQVLFNMAYLFITRTELNFNLAFFEVALPSILLNMFLAIPMHAIVRELAHYAFPKGIEA